MSIRVGIIGCGGISRAHARAFLANGAVIAGVTDSNPQSAQALSEELGGVPVCSDFEQLIQEASPDAVTICTPPSAHESAAIYALSKGIKVLCEKPLSYDAPSAHRIRSAVDESSASLMPAFRHRFLPAIIKLKEIVASGTIGDPVLFNNIFCGPAFGMEGKWFTKKEIAGGGCLLDTNSHSVDLFRFIIGEIADQSAMMHRHFKTTDVEDAGILVVKAENGAVGSMQSSFVAGTGVAFIDIIGTKGQAVYDYFESDIVRYKLTQDSDWTRISVESSDGFDEEIAHFLGFINGDNELSCTVNDGVRVMEVIDSVYRQ